MKRMQAGTVLCRECGCPFWGEPYLDLCPQCHRDTREKAKPSEGVRLGAGFAIRSKSDNWKRRGRAALILPLPPIKDVVEGYQPENRPYPGRVFEKKKDQMKDFAVIQLQPGKPLVLRKGEYREVEPDEQ